VADGSTTKLQNHIISKEMQKVMHLACMNTTGGHRHDFQRVGPILPEIDAVMAGLGISLLSYHTVAHEVEEGRLAILKVQGTPVIRKWYVARNRRKNLLPYGQALWNFIEADGFSYLPSLKKQRG
jgi:DNA-binding transcriptional LysR family regulator